MCTYGAYDEELFKSIFQNAIYKGIHYGNRVMWIRLDEIVEVWKE
jgi:hypothetical protein